MLLELTKKPQMLLSCIKLSKSSQCHLSLIFFFCKKQLDNSHPFGVHVAWFSGSGHMLVAAGYNYSDGTVYLIDPWKDRPNSYMNYSTLLNSIQIGSNRGKCISLITY